MSAPVHFKPLRCPTRNCGHILAEAITVTLGSIEIKCKYCKQIIKVGVVPDPDTLIRYAQQLKTAETTVVESTLTEGPVLP